MDARRNSKSLHWQWECQSSTSYGRSTATSLRVFWLSVEFWCDARLHPTKSLTVPIRRHFTLQGLWSRIRPVATALHQKSCHHYNVTGGVSFTDVDTHIDFGTFVERVPGVAEALDGDLNPSSREKRFTDFRTRETYYTIMGLWESWRSLLESYQNFVG